MDRRIMTLDDYFSTPRKGPLYYCNLQSLKDAVEDKGRFSGLEFLLSTQQFSATSSQFAQDLSSGKAGFIVTPRPSNVFSILYMFDRIPKECEYVVGIETSPAFDSTSILEAFDLPGTLVGVNCYDTAIGFYKDLFEFPDVRENRDSRYVQYLGCDMFEKEREKLWETIGYQAVLDLSKSAEVTCYQSPLTEVPYTSEEIDLLKKAFFGKDVEFSWPTWDIQEWEALNWLCIWGASDPECSNLRDDRDVLDKMLEKGLPKKVFGRWKLWHELLEKLKVRALPHVYLASKGQHEPAEVFAYLENIARVYRMDDRIEAVADGTPVEEVLSDI